MQLRTDLAAIRDLGGRSVRQTLRRPQLVSPIIVFPTLLLAVQTGGAGGAVDLPAFPDVDGFLDFMLAGAMIQSALLAGNSGGIAMAVDIESGFTDRLMAAPISRFAIVLGRLAGTAVLGLISAAWYIVLGLAFGARIEEGVVGVALMFVLVILAAIAFGTLSAALALKTGSASVVQGMFPIVFVVLFLSSAFFPSELMLEPAASIAEFNPLSFVVQGIRDPIVSTLTPGDLAAAFGAVIGVGAVGLGLSSLALRSRLASG